MPIEIKELVIRATVGDGAPPQASGASQGSTLDQEAIIEACVEQVLQILKDKEER
jgi:hypothetical protein